MKKTIYIAGLLIGMFCLSGCEKEVKDYDGQEGVYFYVQWGAAWGDSTDWAAQPYTKVEFIKRNASEIELKLRVNVTGRIKNYDRKFRVIVDKDSTTAVENENYISIPEIYTLPAGRHYAEILVTVKNSVALNETERRLVLRLQPTEELGLAIPVWHDLSGMWTNDADLDKYDGTRHSVIMNNFLIRPTVWPGTQNPEIGQAEGGSWGVFSKEKYEEIIKEFPDLTYEDFMSTTTMPTARQYAIRNRMARVLQKLFDAGTPKPEKDGRLMWFSGVSWKSYYGIPYKPE